MIAVTSEASTAIRQMTNTDVYPEAGLRIATAGQDRFALNLVPHPADQDVTVRVEGAHVYLDKAAAEALDHAILAVEEGSWGAEQFHLDAS